MNATASLPLSDRIALTLDGLCRAVAARIAGGAMAAALIVMIWRRVRRIEGRLQRLLTRFRAGRLWFRVVPAGWAGGGGARRSGAKGVPQTFGWLLPLVPQHAAGFASQFRVVLDDPEMVALLAACPQARRVLAPLCRMLGIEAEVLGALPVRRRVSRVASEAEAVPAGKRGRTRREKVEWRIPLPRGVMAWARREGFGKVPRG